MGGACESFVFATFDLLLEGGKQREERWERGRWRGRETRWLSRVTGRDGWNEELVQTKGRGRDGSE